MVHINLAPIYLAAYKRLWHLHQTVDALIQNELAKESILYISSDAPRSGDEKAVAEVREYIRSIKGFKDVIIIESEKNSNAQNTIENSIKILNIHDKIIILEDDVVVSKNFLKFMNEGLRIYKDNKNIFGICGFLPPINYHKELLEDLFISKKITFYGLGTWKNRGYENALCSGKYAYLDLLQNFSNYLEVYSRFPKVANYSLKKMMKVKDHMIVGDALIGMHISINKMFNIFPKYTMTKNIGMDGSGTHSATNKRYDVKLTNFDPIIKENIKYNADIDRVLIEFYDSKRMISVDFIKYLFDKVRYHIGIF